MSPPPLTGTTTASISGHWARISSPTVPCPAMTASSLNGGTIVAPRSAHSRAATSNRSDASHSTSSAPSARIAACLTGGAVRGMTMQACVPKRCAA